MSNSNETSIDNTLDEREKLYGTFRSQAMMAQALKDTMRLSDSWRAMTPAKKEALDMIQHKVARILNSESASDYIDNWHDVAGYATLVERELIK